MRNIKIILTLACFMAIPAYSQQSATTIDGLLDRVEQGKINDNQENQKRESEFRQKRDQQEILLADAETKKVMEEIRSTDLEALFEKNEVINNDLQDTLNERLGALKELFGVMQQVAGDARTRFDNSLTNIQYPDRSAFLEDLAKKITRNISVPTIGIGASKFCDGQILVADDMLGLSNFKPRFVKQYINLKKIIKKCVKNYAKDIKLRRFPSSENVYR